MRAVPRCQRTYVAELRLVACTALQRYNSLDCLPSVCLSVCLSVTRCYCFKATELISSNQHCMIAIAYSDRGEIPTELRFAKFEVAVFGEKRNAISFQTLLN